MYAGVVAWVFAILLPSTMDAAEGLYSPRLMLYATFAGIVELVVAAIIGAALYKEAEFTAAYPAAAPQATR